MNNEELKQYIFNFFSKHNINFEEFCEKFIYFDKSLIGRGEGIFIYMENDKITYREYEKGILRLDNTLTLSELMYELITIYFVNNVGGFLKLRYPNLKIEDYKEKWYEEQLDFFSVFGTQYRDRLLEERRKKNQ